MKRGVGGRRGIIPKLISAKSRFQRPNIVCSRNKNTSRSVIILLVPEISALKRPLPQWRVICFLFFFFFYIVLILSHLNYSILKTDCTLHIKNNPSPFVKSLRELLHLSHIFPRELWIFVMNEVRKSPMCSIRCLGEQRLVFQIRK